MSMAPAAASRCRKCRWMSRPAAWKNWRPSSRLRFRSIRPHCALDGRAPHQPTLRGWKIGARVRGAAVVPEQKIADPPDVFVDEFFFLGMVEHGVEERLGLFLRHALDTHGHQPVDIDSLAAGVLVSAKYWMDAFTERHRAFAVALLH